LPTGLPNLVATGSPAGAVVGWLAVALIGAAVGRLAEAVIGAVVGWLAVALVGSLAVALIGAVADRECGVRGGVAGFAVVGWLGVASTAGAEGCPATGSAAPAVT
jgi:hypothetical protein